MRTLESITMRWNLNINPNDENYQRLVACDFIERVDFTQGDYPWCPDPNISHGNGELINGKPHGSWRFYSSDNRRHTIGHYHFGRPNLHWKYYTPDGSTSHVVDMGV